MHKTGFLYEVIGREDVAFERYMQAIGDVLRRQSTVLAAGARPVDPNSWQAIMNQRTDTTVSREYREHYASLEQGLLLSWPEDEGESEAAKGELKALFDTELRNVLDRDEEELLPLARYARLDRTARLVRTVGFFLDDRDLAQYADHRLLAHFGEDADFAGYLVEAYGAAGRPLPDGISVDDEDGALAALTPLRRQLALAGKREDFETQLQLLRLDGAYDEMETLLGERILDGKFREGLGYALGLLGGPEFRRLALATSSKLLEERDAFKALVGSNVDMLLKAEEVVGQPLAPTKEVIELLLDPGAGAEPASPFGFNDNSGYWQYLEERGSTQDRIRFLQAEVERTQRGGSSEWLASIGSFRALVKGELTPRQRNEISDTVIERLSSLRNTNNANVRFFVHAFLPLDAHPSNVEILYRIAQFAESHWLRHSGTLPLLKAAYEGRPVEVFRHLLELGYGWPEQPVHYPGYTYLELREALAAPRARMLDKIASGGQVGPRLASTAYEIEFPDKHFPMPTRAESRRQASLLDQLRRLDPERELHRVRLIRAWLNLGYTGRAEKAIAGAYRASPDNDFWRLAYLVLLRSQQRFEEALAVAADGDLDFRDVGVYRSELAARTGDISRPLDRFLRHLLELAGERPALGSLGANRRAPQRLARALIAGEPVRGRQALRESWRRLLAPRQSGRRATPGKSHLQSAAASLLNASLPRYGQDEAPMEARMLFDAVADSPYGAGELEAYLRAMPDGTRKGLPRLYGYLVRATAGGQRRQELWSRLRERKIDDHEFTLWMLLRDGKQGELAAGEWEALNERLTSIADPSPFQLVLAARIFSSTGAVEKAAEHYRLVAARMIRHQEYVAPERVTAGGPLNDSGIANLLELAEELTARLPEAEARGTAEHVLALARRADDLPGADALFDVLVLALLGKVYGPRELLEQLRRSYPGILTLPDHLTGIGAAKAVELVRAYARGGETGRAIEILGAMLKGPVSRTRPVDVENRRKYLLDNILYNLAALYGINTLTPRHGYSMRVLAGVDAILASQERLFPASGTEWRQDSEWIDTVAQTLLGRLEDGQAEQADVLELLGALGMRAVRMGERDHAVGLLTRTIASVESSGAPPSPRGVMSLAALAQMTGSSPRLQLVADALKEDGLFWRDKLRLVSLFETSEEIGQMLKLARDHGVDHGLAMLRQLHTMAERAGDTAFANDLEERIRREAAARDILKGLRQAGGQEKSPGRRR